MAAKYTDCNIDPVNWWSLSILESPLKSFNAIHGVEEGVTVTVSGTA